MTRCYELRMLFFLDLFAVFFDLALWLFIEDLPVVPIEDFPTVPPDRVALFFEASVSG
jgi:hypothetical protein